MKLAVANAIAHQRFEGLEPSIEVIQDLEAIAEGHLTSEQALETLRQRYPNVEVCRA